MKMFKKIIFIFLIILSFDTSIVSYLHADNKDSLITVYCDKEVSRINKKVYGNNIIAYDPMTYEDWAKEYYGYSDYGSGIWDPGRKRSVKEVMDLAKEAGVTIFRFPGGCGTHHYNWKNAIGEDRKHFLYGIDEFLETCEEMNIESIFTVSYFTGDRQDAADLVEYLNYPDDENNPNGGIDWAKERAKNGHALPYNVKYFEIGNEVWHGDHGDIKSVSPEQYAERYLEYYYSMKSIDPHIKIGAVLYERDWDRKILETIKDRLDFAVIHTYPVPSWAWEKEPRQIRKAEDIFKITLGVPIFRDEFYYKDTAELLETVSGKDVPLAITEYNGAFMQNKPVPYRHCLGTALLNAELLRIFMKPEYRVFMANYWQFSNCYWGMVKTREDYMKYDYRYHINYDKRPNYYVFELYKKHFGPILLDTDVECESYSVEDFFIPYLSVNASINAEKNKIFLMVINKNLKKPVSATIDLKDFKLTEKSEAWILNGPSIDSTNEHNARNVKIKHIKFKIKAKDFISDSSFTYTFEPHSVTAIEIKRRGN